MDAVVRVTEPTCDHHQVVIRFVVTGLEVVLIECLLSKDG